MAHNRDTLEVPDSVEVRRMKRSLDSAFVYAWEGSGRGRRLVFQNRFSLHEFFDVMTRMGDRGYLIGAAIFAHKATGGEVHRAVRSHLLTRLARIMHDDLMLPAPAVREAEVAHFGRFVDALIGDFPQLHVEWAEDMNSDAPEDGFAPEPTAVVRGVFLSPSLDQRHAVKFWDLASASARFPRRIFSDPCRPEDGTLFSSYHCRAFSFVFSHASDAAVERFIAHMREHAVRKTTKVFDERAQRWHDEEVEALAVDRSNAFACIAGNIADSRRREKVAQLFGIAA